MKENVFTQWFSFIVMFIIIIILSFFLLKFMVSSYQQSNNNIDEVREIQEKVNEEIKDLFE